MGCEHHPDESGVIYDCSGYQGQSFDPCFVAPDGIVHPHWNGEPAFADKKKVAEPKAQPSAMALLGRLPVMSAEAGADSWPEAVGAQA